MELKPQLVRTTKELIDVCNGASPTISASLSLHELISVHQHATKEYNKGNRVMQDPTFDLVTHTLNFRTTAAFTSLHNNIQTLKLTELQHIKAFCDATYAKGTPSVNDTTYNALNRETQRRATDVVTQISNAKTNPFVSANWSNALLFDVICGLNSSFALGSPHLENKCYDIIVKELSIRIQSSDTLQFPLYSHLMNVPYNWNYPTSAIDQIELMTYSGEYADVIKLLHASLPHAIVHSIKRIQNYGLWRMHNLTRRHIASRSHVEPDQVHMRMLFHGCAQAIGCEEIIKFGFYRQYCPNGAIGDGCYFALNASYSNNPPYVLQYPDGTKQLFLAQVLVGNGIRGYYGTKAPPAGGDSVHDGGPTHMYCIFDHYQAYPEYVIHYSS